MIKRHPAYFEGALIRMVIESTQKTTITGYYTIRCDLVITIANPSSHSLAGKGVKKGRFKHGTHKSVFDRSFRKWELNQVPALLMSISKKVGVLHVLNVLESGLHVFLQHLVTLLFSTQFVCKRGFTHGVKNKVVLSLKSKLSNRVKITFTQKLH